MKKKSLIFNFMLLFLALVILILTAFLALILFVQRISLRQAEYMMRKEHSQTVENIDAYLASLENTAFTASYSSTTQAYIQKEPVERVIRKKEMETLYLNATVMFQDIKGFSLYNSHFENILSLGQSISGRPVQGEDGSSQQIQYSDRYTTASGITAFSIIYPVYRVKTTKLLGELMGYTGLTVDVNGLSQVMAARGLYPDNHLLLLDASGNIMSANTSEKVTGTMMEEWMADQSSYLCICTTLPRCGWQLISVMPKGVVAQEFQRIVPLMGIAGAIVLLLIISAVGLLYRQVLNPIRKLSNFMARVSTESETARYTAEGQDEIGILARTLNHMLDEIGRRNEKLRISETERLKATLKGQQMEILAYHNQINPHFLYNTFECIRGIAFYHDAPEIAEISQSLSRMLRYAVRAGNMVSLGEEVQYIREYARIINYRFDGKITLHYQIPEEMSGIRVNKLCLQPLVENAASHGFDARQTDGTILLSAAMEGGNVLLTVADNGNGMDAQTLSQLRETIQKAWTEESEVPATGQHIGIANVARRLFLNYGSAGRMLVDSSPGGGTRVTFQIPAETEVDSDV